MKKQRSISLILGAWLLCGSLLNAEEWSFDLGPAAAPAATGWTRLGEKELFSDAKGYGWTQHWGYGGTYDKANEEELKTYIGAQGNTQEAIFKLKVPNGAYLVTVRLGSNIPSEGRDGQCVAINGHEVLPPPGVGGWGKLITRTLPAVVDDGLMTIRFFTPKAKPTQRLNLYSLQIRPATEAEKAVVEQDFAECAPGVAVAPREITINGKKINEVGRKPLKKAPEWTTQEKAQKMVFFSPDFSGAILDDTVPARGEIKEKLTGFAAPGEIQPFFAGLHALEQVNIKNITLSPLTASDGSRFDGKGDLYSISCVYRSPFDTINFDGKLAPELLERNFTFAMPQGATRPFYFTIQVPAGQKAGTYRGELIAESDDATIKLPFELTVLPFELEKPQASFVLGADPGRWRGMSDANIREEVREMAAHGVNGLMVGMAPVGMPLMENAAGDIAGLDFDRMEPYFKLAHQLGINKTLLLSATNQMLWMLPNWQINHRSGQGSHHTDKNFTIRHQSADSVTHLQNLNYPPLFSPRQYRFSIRYRSTGAISGNAVLQILDAFRRPSQQDIVLQLPATNGQDREVALEFTADNPAALTRAAIAFQGAGDWTLDEIRLAPLDRPELNFLINGRLLRSIETVDWNQPWPEAFVKNYQDTIRANADAARKLGFTPVIVGTDEAGNNPKSEYQEIREMDEVKKIGEDTFCNLSPALGVKTLPQLSIACFYADLLGNSESTAKIVDFYHRNGKQIYGISGGTYAGQNFSIMANRYNIGFFVFKNRLDGLWIWTFQRPGNDPYDDFDSRNKDYCLVYPPRQAGGEAVKSIAYEGIREGIRDYQYLQTLENAVKKAERDGRTRDAANGRMILDCILKAIPEYGSFNENTFNDRVADQLRELAALGIASLSGKAVFQDQTTPKATIKLDELKEKNVPAIPAAIVPAFDASVTLDGKLDEPEWKKAMAITSFSDYIRNVAIPGTQAFLRQDKDYLYIGVTAQSQPGKKSAGNDTEESVFANDHFEIMLDDGLDRQDWFQLCFDEFGNKADLKCVGSRNGSNSIFAVNYGAGPNQRDISWNSDWQVKVDRQGNQWTAEAAIPLALLGEGKMRHGLLIGRGGFGATVSNKAIGFFDQVEKYPVITLAGSDANLLAIDLDAFKTGRQLTNFKFGKLRSGKVTITEYTGDGSPSVFSGVIRPDGTAAVHWRLSAKSAKIMIQAADATGKVVWEMEDAFQLPPPLMLDAPDRVFFDKANSFKAELKLQISPELAKTGKLLYQLTNSQGAVIAKTESPAQSRQIDIPLSGLSYGFYRLSVKLADGQTDIAATTVDFALVPSIK